MSDSDSFNFDSPDGDRSGDDSDGAGSASDSDDARSASDSDIYGFPPPFDDVPKQYDPDIKTNPYLKWMQIQTVDASFQEQETEWTAGAREDLEQKPYEVIWEPDGPGGRTWYLYGQIQRGSLCGLHAINAVKGVSEKEFRIDNITNLLNGKPTFPYYTQKMLESAKILTVRLDIADYPEGVSLDGDESDPTSLTILGRNRGDLFPIRVDVLDDDYEAYVSGLYPLPEKGRWIISYPGHHIAVWRNGENFAILDSLERFDGPNKRAKLLNSSQDYVDFVQSSFGRRYSYVIFYEKELLKDGGIYEEVLKADIDGWEPRGHPTLTWGEFAAKKVREPGRYNPEGRLYVSNVASLPKPSRGIDEYFPSRITGNASDRWKNATYELVGLCGAPKRQSAGLIERQEHLKRYLQALEANNGQNLQGLDLWMRDMVIDGRVSFGVDEFVKYSDVPVENRTIRRHDWMLIIEFLMNTWLQGFIDRCLLDVDAKIRKEWKTNLKSRWQSLLVREVFLWNQVEWEYIPLTRQFFDELVRVVKEETETFGPSGKHEELKKIIERWIPAGVAESHLLADIPGPSQKELFERARKFVTDATGIVNTLHADTKKTIKIRSIRQFDAVIRIAGLSYLHSDFSEFVEQHYPGSFISKEGEFFDVYVTTERSRHLLLSEEVQPFSVSEFYTFLENKILLETNFLWNPRALLEELSTMVENHIARGGEDARADAIDEDPKKGLLLVLSILLIKRAFSVPEKALQDPETRKGITELLSLWRERDYIGYNDVANTWLVELEAKEPDSICESVGFRCIVPIHYNDLQALAGLEQSIDDFKSLSSRTTNHNTLDTFFKRSTATLEFLDISTKGIENPIPRQVWIDPDQLDEALERVSVVSDITLLREELSKLFPDEKYKRLYDSVWNTATNIATATRLPLNRVWLAILKAYRRRKLPLTEGVVDLRTVQKILLTEQFEDIQAELKKASSGMYENALEERVIIPEQNNADDVTGSVELRTHQDPFGPDHADRMYFYRWRFEHVGKTSKKLVREWSDGPTYERRSVATIPAAAGDGVLSCEVYILKVQGAKNYYVARTACKNTLILRVLYKCVRCDKNYSRFQNVHGDCTFHPKPSPAHSYLIGQAGIPNEARDWDYFLNILRSSWPWLDEPKKKTWLDKATLAFGYTENANFDTIYNGLDHQPFTIVLDLLEQYPWKSAIESEFTRHDLTALPRTVREWMAILPMNYIRRIKEKVAKFNNERLNQSGYQAYQTILQPLPEIYQELVCLAAEHYENSFSDYERDSFFAEVKGHYPGLVQFGEWIEQLLSATDGVDNIALVLLRDRFPWSVIFEREEDIENLAMHIDRLIKTGNKQDPASRDSRDPCRAVLVGLTPYSIWFDDRSTEDFKRIRRPFGYGYDQNKKMWLCCGKKELESQGCWQDVHSQKNPYIRFLGHFDAGDYRGSWPLQRKADFGQMWNELHRTIDQTRAAHYHRDRLTAEKPKSRDDVIRIEQALDILGGEIIHREEEMRRLLLVYFGIQLQLSGYAIGDTLFWPVPAKRGPRHDTKFMYERTRLVVDPPFEQTSGVKVGTLGIFEKLQKKEKPHRREVDRKVKKGSRIPATVKPFGEISPVFRLRREEIPIIFGVSGPTYERSNLVPVLLEDGGAGFNSALPCLSLALGPYMTVPNFEALPILSIAMRQFGTAEQPSSKSSQWQF